MFYRIKENKIFDYADYKYDEECLETDITNSSYLNSNEEQFKIQNGILVDISDTNEYKSKIAAKEKELTLANLKLQIEEIDRKRIRAIAEPSLYDAQNGKTWLEHYNEQIIELREQILQL